MPPSATTSMANTTSDWRGSNSSLSPPPPAESDVLFGGQQMSFALDPNPPHDGPGGGPGPFLAEHPIPYLSDLDHDPGHDDPRHHDDPGHNPGHDHDYNDNNDHDPRSDSDQDHHPCSTDKHDLSDADLSLLHDFTHPLHDDLVDDPADAPADLTPVAPGPAAAATPASARGEAFGVPAFGVPAFGVPAFGVPSVPSVPCLPSASQPQPTTSTTPHRAEMMPRSASQPAAYREGPGRGIDEEYGHGHCGNSGEGEEGENEDDKDGTAGAEGAEGAEGNDNKEGTPDRIEQDTFDPTEDPRILDIQQQFVAPWEQLEAEALERIEQFSHAIISEACRVAHHVSASLYDEFQKTRAELEAGTWGIQAEEDTQYAAVQRYRAYVAILRQAQEQIAAVETE